MNLRVVNVGAKGPVKGEQVTKVGLEVEIVVAEIVVVNVRGAAKEKIVINGIGVGTETETGVGGIRGGAVEEVVAAARIARAVGRVAAGNVTDRDTRVAMIRIVEVDQNVNHRVKRKINPRRRRRMQKTTTLYRRSRKRQKQMKNKRKMTT